MQYQQETILQEDNLAIPSTNLNPDLKVPPWPSNEQHQPQTAQQVAGAVVNPCCCSCDPAATATKQESCPKSIHTLEEQQPLKGILKKSPQPADPGMATATAGRTAPGEEHPTAKPPVPNELRPVPQERPPCYLPQPEDATMTRQEMEMGPIGPWATGRIDWGPLAGLTGTRPVVDKYSITRYSEGEWRKHNKDMLDMALNESHRANL